MTKSPGEFCHPRATVDKMCRMSGKLLRLLLLLTLGTMLPSCTFFQGRSNVLVTSTPAGAAVYLDGQDTGETTPIRLDLGNFLFVAGYFAGDHEITIRKSGFEPETRRIYHHSSYYTSKWINGSSDWVFLPLPLFWSTGDWFTPFGVKWDYVPHELHVKLYPVGEAPGQRP